VIVVVAAEESLPAIRGALPDHPIEHASTVPTARPHVDGADLVVVDEGTVAESGELIAGLRGDGAQLPPALVVVVPADTDPPDDLLPVDHTVWAPFERGALRTAARRGLLAAEYHRAVSDLFVACRSRAEGGTTDPLEESGDLQTARRSADEILEAAADEPGLLAAILRCSVDE
jgi:hypothetical protein